MRAPIPYVPCHRYRTSEVDALALSEAQTNGVASLALGAKIVLTEDGCTAFSCMLNQLNLQTGENKFYKVPLTPRCALVGAAPLGVLAYAARAVICDDAGVF